MYILSIFKIVLDFFKKRIRKYQEKKLDEITSKIQFHQYTKKQLEQKIEEMINNEKTAIIKEISFHGKMINIWKNNEEKLKKQMSEMED
jgi:tRNA U34 5-carboxymethylaminomethyl modifying enzyme MnmG/GidA